MLHAGDAFGYQATERAAGLAVPGQAPRLRAVSSVQARQGVHHPAVEGSGHTAIHSP